jgi:signal transduction histidine kinase
VTVSDSGIGIPPGALASVFEMFSQLHPGAQGEAGLGIGLALVRQLVQMHGGSVEAASEGAGRGSTFTVRLPLMEAAMPSAASSDAAAPVR